MALWGASVWAKKSRNSIKPMRSLLGPLVVGGDALIILYISMSI
jgi:hypothetical protein